MQQLWYSKLYSYPLTHAYIIAWWVSIINLAPSSHTDTTGFRTSVPFLKDEEWPVDADNQPGSFLKSYILNKSTDCYTTSHAFTPAHRFLPSYIVVEDPNRGPGKDWRRKQMCQCSTLFLLPPTVSNSSSWWRNFIGHKLAFYLQFSFIVHHMIMSVHTHVISSHMHILCTCHTMLL